MGGASGRILRAPRVSEAAWPRGRFPRVHAPRLTTRARSYHPNAQCPMPNAQCPMPPSIPLLFLHHHLNLHSLFLCASVPLWLSSFFIFIFDRRASTKTPRSRKGLVRLFPMPPSRSPNPHRHAKARASRGMGPRMEGDRDPASTVGSNRAAQGPAASQGKGRYPGSWRAEPAPTKSSMPKSPPRRADRLTDSYNLTAADLRGRWISPCGASVGITPRRLWGLARRATPLCGT